MTAFLIYDSTSIHFQHFRIVSCSQNIITKKFLLIHFILYVNHTRRSFFCAKQTHKKQKVTNHLVDPFKMESKKRRLSVSSKSISKDMKPNPPILKVSRALARGHKTQDADSNTIVTIEGLKQSMKAPLVKTICDFLKIAKNKQDPRERIMNYCQDGSLYYVFCTLDGELFSWPEHSPKDCRRMRIAVDKPVLRHTGIVMASFISRVYALAVNEQSALYAVESKLPEFMLQQAQKKTSRLQVIDMTKPIEEHDDFIIHALCYFLHSLAVQQYVHLEGRNVSWIFFLVFFLQGGGGSFLFFIFRTLILLII